MNQEKSLVYNKHSLFQEKDQSIFVYIKRLAAI